MSLYVVICRRQGEDIGLIVDGISKKEAMRHAASLGLGKVKTIADLLGKEMIPTKDPQAYLIDNKVFEAYNRMVELKKVAEIESTKTALNAYLMAKERYENLANLR